MSGGAMDGQDIMFTAEEETMQGMEDTIDCQEQLGGGTLGPLVPIGTGRFPGKCGLIMAKEIIDSILANYR
jgi:hypothetical protein